MASRAACTVLFIAVTAALGGTASAQTAAGGCAPFADADGSRWRVESRQDLSCAQGRWVIRTIVRTGEQPRGWRCQSVDDRELCAGRGGGLSARRLSAPTPCGFNLTPAKPLGTGVSVWTTHRVGCEAAVRAVERGRPRLRLRAGGGTLRVRGWRCRLTLYRPGVDSSWTFRCRDGRRSFLASGRP